MANNGGKLINLMRGWPAPSLLPVEAIAAASQRALSSSQSVPALLYGPDEGCAPLRGEIGRWLNDFYQIPPSTHRDAESESGQQGRKYGRGRDGQGNPVDAAGERIVITGGASQNLACLLQAYADPGVTDVWMVAPCYFLAQKIFEDAGLKCRAVAEDGEGGLDLEGLEGELVRCEKKGRPTPIKRSTTTSKIYRHIIYLVPTFSNPSGLTLSLETRTSLVRLARKYDALLITDDVYDFLQWPTPTSRSSKPLSHALLPRLVDIDRTLAPVPGEDHFGNSVSNGSFSKIAGPGVRTGWAEGTERFVYGLSQVGSSTSGGAPSHLTAFVMYELLKSGDLQRHIDGVLKPAYERRWGVMMGAIRKFLAPLGVRVRDSGEEGITGGYFIWITLPEGTSSEEVVARAQAEENLVVAKGAAFEVKGDQSVRFERGIRLTFSWELEEDLEIGVERLGRVIRWCLKHEAREGAAAGNDDGEFK